MSSQFDASDFVDSDFQAARTIAAAAPETAIVPTASNRPPNREEIEALVSEKQLKLAELRRAQDELERERANLEELRRRQMEFQTGRGEMLQHLTRGIGLLEEAELNARRDAEQMTRTLVDFREAINKLQVLNENAWSKEDFNIELTRALTTIENARMEWNSARLKFPLLSGELPQPTTATPNQPALSALADLSFVQLCKVGAALTWPLVAVGAAILLVLLLRG